MSEARLSPPRGRAGREVDYYYEKGNLEIGDPTDSISSHRSSYNTWCYKLHVVANGASPIPLQRERANQQDEFFAAKIQYSKLVV